MEDRSKLLEQLRIDRAAPPPAGGGAGGGRWRWVAGIVVIVILLGGGFIAWIKVSAADAVPIRTAVAAAAQTGTALAAGGSALDASGYVVALRQASVAAKSIYKVDEVLVQAGDVVKRNQVIAKLDDTNARAELEQSQAQVKQLTAALAAAKLAVTDAHPAYLRDKTQLKEGLISQDAYDSVQASYDAAVAAVEVAEQNLAVAKANVTVNQRFEDDTVIRSPFDGVVTVKNAQPGQIVSPQFSGGGGIAQIVDMDSLEVDVDVSENFISRVHAKQSATIMLNAYPDWRIPAEVIAIVPTADRSKATVEVRVGFKQKDPRILPEMGARVSFLAQDSTPSAAASGAASTAVLIPTDAVQANGDSGTVFIVNGSTVQSRVVRLGAQSSTGQTVLSGLDAGATVAIGDFTKLHDGARVRITQ
jgi:RND family efflux transporter MFP subunit